MTAWADSHGCPRVVVSEHHGSQDGYLPSPFVFAGAVAARTEQNRIMVSALVLTLRDPVATAEDVAVLDLISGGRVELTVGGRLRGRGVRHVRRPLRRARCRVRGEAGGTGGGVDGRALRLPRPGDHRHPGTGAHPRPLVVVGGSPPKRAARFGDAFLPAVAEAHLGEAYVAECRRLGKGDGILLWPGGPMWVFVTEIPNSRGRRSDTPSTRPTATRRGRSPPRAPVPSPRPATSPSSGHRGAMPWSLRKNAWTWPEVSIPGPP